MPLCICLSVCLCVCRSVLRAALPEGGGGVEVSASGSRLGPGRRRRCGGAGGRHGLALGGVVVAVEVRSLRPPGAATAAAASRLRAGTRLPVLASGPRGGGECRGGAWRSPAMNGVGGAGSSEAAGLRWGWAAGGWGEARSGVPWGWGAAGAR